MCSRKIPKFIYRYGNKLNNHQMKDLESKIKPLHVQKSYNNYLQSYNSFHLFQWASKNNERINRKYYWNEVFKRELYNIEANPENRTDPLKEPIDTKQFELALGTSISDKLNETELQCVFNSSVGMSYLLDVIKLADSDVHKLKLVTVGIRINGKGNLSENSELIQSLLEESASMYKNINYANLLKIAKSARITESNPNRQFAYELLHKLSQLHLTTPTITSDMRWLLFMKDQSKSLG